MMDFTEHTAYKRALELSNSVWKIVLGWDKFAQFTIGNQWVRSMDSVSANIAEGWYKNTKKHRVKYYRISQTSLAEAKDWITKARVRQLIAVNDHQNFSLQYELLAKDINGLIKGTLQMLKY